MRSRPGRARARWAILGVALVALTLLLPVLPQGTVANAVHASPEATRSPSVRTATPSPSAASSSTLILVNGTDLPSVVDATSSNAGDPTVIGWDPIASEVWATGNANYGGGSTQAVATYNESSGSYDPPIVLGGGSISNPVIPSTIVYDAKHHQVDVVDEGAAEVRVWNASSFPGHGLVTNLALGGAPVGAAIDGATGALWVTDPILSRVDVVNTAARTVAEFPSSQAWCVAYDAPTDQMFVGNLSDLSAYNATTGALVTTIPVPCFAIAIDPLNGSAFVVDQTSNVSVVLGTTDAFFENVSLPNATGFGSIAYDAAAGAMLALDPASVAGHLGVLDLANLSFVRSVTLGRSPAGVEVADSVDRVFIGNSIGNNVTELNATTFASVRSITVGGTPYAVYRDPGSGDLIVPDPTSLGAWVVAPGAPPHVLGLVRYPDGTGLSAFAPSTSAAWDPALGKLLLASSGGSELSELAGNPPGYVGAFPTPFVPAVVGYDGGHREVLVAASQNVAFLNATTGAVITNLTVGLPSGLHEPAQAIVYDPATQNDYILFGATFGVESGVLVEISGATHAPLGNVSVDRDAWNLALDGTGARLFVSGTFDANLTAVNATSLAIVQRTVLPGAYGLSGGGAGIAYDAALGRLYAVDSVTDTVQVYNGTTYAEVGSYPAPEGAEGVYVNGTSGEVFVAASFSDALHIYDGLAGPLLAGFTANPPVVSVGNGTILLTRAYGAPPLTYVYGNLPSGCLSRNTSSLACYPQLAGSYPVNVTVTDGTHASVSASLTLDVVGTAPGERFHVAFVVEPGLCQGLRLGGTTYGNGTEDNVTVGVYPISVLPCPGYSSAYVVGGGAVTANSTQMTVLGNGTVTVVYLLAGIAIVGVLVRPAACDAVVVLNGTRYANGSAAFLPVGKYAVSAGSCAGWEFHAWTTSGGLSVSGGYLTVSGNGVLTANYTSSTTSNSFGIPLVDLLLVGIIVVVVAAAVWLGTRGRRRSRDGVPVLQGEPIEPGSLASGLDEGPAPPVEG